MSLTLFVPVVTAGSIAFRHEFDCKLLSVTVLCSTGYNVMCEACTLLLL